MPHGKHCGSRQTCRTPRTGFSAIPRGTKRTDGCACIGAADCAGPASGCQRSDLVVGAAKAVSKVPGEKFDQFGLYLRWDREGGFGL
jgi:hypothetical protein